MTQFHFLLHSVVRGKVPYLRLWLKLSEGHEHAVSHSNHCVRVEAIVLHHARDWDEPRVLCVRERYSTDPTFVKLPSGSVDRHEFLECAAKREVLEETDLQAYYEGIVGFWENRFGSNELVTLTFGVRMRLEPEQDPALININERELREAFWVPLSRLRDTFANRPEGAWHARIRARRPRRAHRPLRRARPPPRPPHARAKSHVPSRRGVY
jgi:8-oxo-dGTP pyrophosphatase MutT (NUDIX family)